MNWTQEQQDIFDFIKNDTGSLYINASAGSGKSSTILEAVNRVQVFNAVFIAFNKHIKNHLSNKLPLGVKAQTVHGICYKVLLNSLGDNYTLEKFKTPKLFGSVVNSIIDRYSKLDSGRVNPKDIKFFSSVHQLYSLNNYSDYKKEIYKLVSYAKKSLIYSGNNGYGILDDKKENWNKIIKNHSEDLMLTTTGNFKDTIIELVRETLRVSSDDLNVHKMIDFDDMIYLPLVFNLKFPKYQIIFCDEVQDMNLSMIEAICRMRTSVNTRLIAVGDIRQCQPSGTKILIEGLGNTKNIEDIEVGDKVVSYNPNKSLCFSGLARDERSLKLVKGKKVTKVSSRNYYGSMYHIKSCGNVSRYTDNHICLVRDKKESKESYVLYLMSKNDEYYRIGISKYKSLASRYSSEGANKLWILKVCGSREKAIKEERIYSTIFGVPQHVFETNGRKYRSVPKFIDDYWGELSNRGYQSIVETNAISLLEYFDKKLDYPFYGDLGLKNKFGGTNSYFEIRACNIIKDFMLVANYDKNNIVYRKDNRMGRKNLVNRGVAPKWSDISDIQIVDHSNKPTKVYSIEVEDFHVYIADNIMTHNCIYGFQGSSRFSIKKLINEFNCDIMTLSYTFRCPKSVVKEAQIYNSNIKNLPNADIGLIKQIDGDFITLFRDNLIKDPENSVIVCRYNSPLMKLSNSLIKNKINFQFSGIYNNKNSYVSLLSKITGDTLKEVRTNLDVYCKDELMKISNSDEHDRTDYMQFFDMYSSLSSVLFGMKKYYSDRKNIKMHIIAEIDKLFNSHGGVKLSTIHAMKGLESKNVFFLDYDKLKERFIRDGSESNLLYVGVTRSKKNLYFVKSDPKFRKVFYG